MSNHARAAIVCLIILFGQKKICKLTNLSDPDMVNGWTKVKTNIPVDLETTPLEVKTSRRSGNININFMSKPNAGPDPDAGIIRIGLRTSQYEFHDCGFRNWQNFQKELPDDVEKIWKISLTRDSSSRKRLHIHCNDVEVANTILDKSTACGPYNSFDWWGWDNDAKYAVIGPIDGADTAEFYRLHPEGSVFFFLMMF